MNKIIDDILSYREMCDMEKVQTLQRGMNYRLNPSYSVILMSQKSNSLYEDKIYPDGLTIEYEGHNVLTNGSNNPKEEDQISRLPSGKITQNGLFVEAVEKFKNKVAQSEAVKVYEKVLPGVWSMKGFFNLIDYKIIHNKKRKVFRFLLRLSDNQLYVNDQENALLKHTRLIPSEVKKEVWKRDSGKCVICSSNQNLHFDHDLPYSKGGTSLNSNNVRLLCMKHNLSKSSKIE